MFTLESCLEIKSLSFHLINNLIKMTFVNSTSTLVKIWFCYHEHIFSRYLEAIFRRPAWVIECYLEKFSLFLSLMYQLDLQKMGGLVFVP